MSAVVDRFELRYQLKQQLLLYYKICPCLVDMNLNLSVSSTSSVGPDVPLTPKIILRQFELTAFPQRILGDNDTLIATTNLWAYPSVSSEEFSHN